MRCFAVERNKVIFPSLTESELDNLDKICKGSGFEIVRSEKYFFAAQSGCIPQPIITIIRILTEDGWTKLGPLHLTMMYINN